MSSVPIFMFTGRVRAIFNQCVRTIASPSSGEDKGRISDLRRVPADLDVSYV